MNIEALSGNLGFNYNLYKEYKKTHSGDKTALFDYLSLTGKDFNAQLQKWENILENGGDGIEGNTLSIDRFYDDEETGKLYFQTKSGEIIEIDSNDESVSLYDSEEEKNALYEELNGGGLLDKTNPFDNMSFGKDDLTFYEYTFEDNATNSQDGLYKEQKLDLTTEDGRNEIKSIISEYLTNNESIDSFSEIFGDESGYGDNVLYNDDNDSKISMAVIQDGRMFTIDYNKETGEASLDEITEMDMDNIIGGNVTGVSFSINNNDELTSAITSETSTTISRNVSKTTSNSSAAGTTSELRKKSTSSSVTNDEIGIHGFDTDATITNNVNNYEKIITTTRFVRNVDPLIFDFDQDGKVEAQAGIGVDLNNDGIADGAATGGDKMLAMGDLNGNGVIDGNEVFGDQTINPFTGEALNAENGFKALSMVAEEAESITGIEIIDKGIVNLQALSEALASFGNIALGLISDGNVTELENLSTISSVDVSNYTEHDENGTVQHRQQGTYTDIFGNVHKVHDVWFAL